MNWGRKWGKRHALQTDYSWSKDLRFEHLELPGGTATSGALEGLRGPDKKDFVW